MNQPNIYHIYNEYVLGEVDYYEDLEDNPVEELIEYDDSGEWYNIYGTEADG
jgi:hypothetical protein